ncbi:MAG: MiaB/RimO family radical SAM methylthiotransferase [Elusimicrobiota bacterium]
MLEKVNIITYGCQMNEAESNSIADFLKTHNYQITENIDDADIIIINTCTVRQHAEDKAISLIGTLKKWKTDRKKIFVTGCAAQRLGKGLKKRFPYIDEIIGAKSYDKIYQLFDKNKTKSNPDITNTFFEKKIFDYQIISKGCNLKCSYCIVPYVRGNEINIPFNEIVKEIKEKAKNGVKEIMLLGQTVNSYRYLKLDFTDLLKEISQIDEIKIIRFMSPHPLFFTKKFFLEYGRNKKISRWLHIPLQSASNKILKKMNRGYTIEKYMEIISELKAQDPSTSITSDIIVGYNGETIKDFELSLKAIEKIRFSNIYCFKYSPRFEAKDPLLISCNELEKRHRILLNEAKKIAKEVAMDKIGRIETVLLYNNKFGRTNTGYNCCIIDNDIYTEGSLLEVKIEDVKTNTLYGRIYA